MALINCRDCGQQVGPEAKTCPRCGRATSRRWLSIAYVCYVIVALGIIAILLLVVLNAYSRLL